MPKNNPSAYKKGGKMIKKKVMKSKAKAVNPYKKKK